VSTKISPAARSSPQAEADETGERSNSVWGGGADLFDDRFAEHVAVAQGTCRCTREGFQEMLETWVDCVFRGGRILFFGNGGSASDAQHLAAELVVRYRHDRSALPAVALTTDSSVLTACGNDLGFEQVFARQIEALGRPGDLAFGLSTSGRSRNVNIALATARTRGLIAAGMTGGDGGDMAQIARPIIIVPSSDTARIQEMHIIIGHVLCEGLEKVLLERGSINS
jgi:D-sedoheptulose 7-phosphate isomerase